MRILAIGLGGAGGRIADRLYQTDRRSSRVACVEALAVDVDAESIARLTSLPETAKICFSPMDLTPSGEGSMDTATIDIAEVTARAQTMATGETDAIVFCMGLGGGLAGVAPNLITAMRATVTEPIFALVTLPCLAEGKRISSQAADDIETLTPLLDGVIVFDNETWLSKIKARQGAASPRKEGFGLKFGRKKKDEAALSPREQAYSLLNDAIVRRVSLILRAGEFRSDGGLDLAEVVLDAGEVLNTMRGMGYITIGYAVEQVSSNPLGFLSRLRPAGLFSDEEHKKASRIVDLAKQAIYHEISAPCDITSAHKALILIAGPSHELSMKGYMTVRKWIDRSIAGLETRSGDYPLISTKFIAVIVMLSGLENIPRITELREIRTQYRERAAAEGAPIPLPTPTADAGGIRDEMIAIRTEKTGRVPTGELPASSGETGGGTARPQPQDAGVTGKRLHQVRATGTTGVSGNEEVSPPRKPDQPVPPITKILASRPGATRAPPEPGKGQGDRGIASEQERRRIEQELRKQRRLAVKGVRILEHPHEGIGAGTGKGEPAEHHGTGVSGGSQADASALPKQVIVRKPAAKTVVVRKKVPVADGDEGQRVPDAPAPSPERAEDRDLLDTWIRQVTDQKKESVTDGDIPLRIDEGIAPARDDALLHTDLTNERTGPDAPDTPVRGIKMLVTPREMKPAAKKRDRLRDDEDVSWVE